MKHIEFFVEDIDFKLENQFKIAEWITVIAKKYEHEIDSLNYIFADDDYILDINKTHLNHDYFTDIITFDLNDIESKSLKSDIFISVDRVRENAESFEQIFIDELHRVMIHGVLHLLGFNDSSDKEKKEMRQKENLALSLRTF